MEYSTVVDFFKKLKKNTHKKIPKYTNCVLVRKDRNQQRRNQACGQADS